MCRLSLATTIAAGITAALQISSAAGQDPLKARTPDWQSATIFVAEIEHVDGRAGALATGIRVLVTRILKDGYRQGLLPGELSAHLLRDDSYTDPVNFWADADVREGQTYLVFSNRKENLTSTMESPYSVTLVTSADDPVADIETIVKSEPLPVSERVQAATVALSNDSKPHSRFMAAYSVALLISASDSEAEELSEALKNLSVAAFSENGKRALLNQCWTQLGVRRDKMPSPLLGAFVTLVAKYFLSEPREKPAGLTWIQNVILLNYLPWISSNEAARAAIRSNLAPETAERLRQRVADTAGGPYATPEQRAQAQRFLAGLESH